jgi:hypothetical protein
MGTFAQAPFMVFDGHRMKVAPMAPTSKTFGAKGQASGTKGQAVTMPNTACDYLGKLSRNGNSKSHLSSIYREQGNAPSVTTQQLQN